MAREMRSPTSSSQQEAAIDLAQVDEHLNELTVAPLSFKKRATIDEAQVDQCVAPLALKTKPKVPAFRSCLKTNGASTKKKVRLTEHNDWNVHHIWPFQRDSPPNTFIPHAEADLLQPTGICSRTDCHFYFGEYHSRGQYEIRYPPPEHGAADANRGSQEAPYRCHTCAQVASMGTSHTRYLATQQSIRCDKCMDDPDLRVTFHPALDDDGEFDNLDTCYGQAHSKDPDCQYILFGGKANVNWLYAHYPERYECCDELLDHY